MKSATRHVVTIVLATSMAIGAAYAAEGDYEDLSACTLPNGIFVIPADRSPAARKSGAVFSFSQNKLAATPALEDNQWTAKEFFAKLLETKAGDLMYSRAEQGMFLAASTRITDLGKHYLYDTDSSY